MKFQLWMVAAPVIVVFVLFFASWKPNIRAGSKAASWTMVSGMTIAFAPVVYFIAVKDVGHEWWFITFVLFILGMKMVIVGAPLVGVAVAVAEGEKTESVYSQLSPEEKKLFWEFFRRAASTGAGAYADSLRKQGRSKEADLIEKIRGMFVN